MEKKQIKQHFTQGNTHIPDLFKQRLQKEQYTNRQLKRYYRMIRRDKKVGSATQVHFNKINQEHIEEVKRKYPQTIKAMMRLARKLVEGEHGELLQIAASGLSDSLLSHRALMFLLLIDACHSKNETHELIQPIDSESFERELTQTEEKDIYMVALGEKGQQNEVQKRLWEQLNAVTTSVDIPLNDLDALVKIFRDYITHFSNPSHLSVGMLIETEKDFDHAIQAALSIKNKEERTRSLVQIVDYLLNRPGKEDIDKAIDVIANIGDEADRAKPLMKLIDKLSSSHLKETPHFDEQVPFEKVEEMIRLAERMEVAGQRYKALQRIAIGLARHNNAKEALRVAERIPNQDLRAYAKSSAVSMLVSQKNFGEAAWLLEQIHEPGYREDAISYIVKGYLDEGCYDEVLTFVDALESSTERSRAARIALNTVIAKNDIEKEKLIKEHFSIV